MDELLREAYRKVIDGSRVEIYDANEPIKITFWSAKVNGRARLFWNKVGLSHYRERSFERFKWLVREHAGIRDARYREVV